MRQTQRLAEREIAVNVDREVYEKIGKEGYNAEYGARPLHRKIQTDILDPLADAIIEGNLESGSNVRVTVEDGKYKFNTSKKRPVKRKKKKREQVFV